MRYHWGFAVGHIYAYAHATAHTLGLGDTSISQPVPMTSTETFSRASSPSHATDLGTHIGTLEVDEPLDFEGDGEAEDEATLDDDDMVYGEECSSDDSDDDRHSDGMDEVFEI